jgi:hypothetical protein
MPRYSHARRGFANRRFPASESWVKTAQRFIHVEDILSGILASRQRGLQPERRPADQPLASAPLRERHDDVCGS